MYFDSEYHRRRAEAEMNLALEASPLAVATRHLELAKLHREVRNQIAEAARVAAFSRPITVDRTDKES